MKSIQELFNDWIEPDVAEYYLACLLGVMEYDDKWINYSEAKGIFMTKNKFGDMLYEMLEKMAKTGLLEKDEDDYQYRWNKSLNEYWLKKHNNTEL